MRRERTDSVALCSALAIVPPSRRSRRSASPASVLLAGRSHAAVAWLAERPVEVARRPSTGSCDGGRRGRASSFAGGAARAPGRLDLAGRRSAASARSSVGSGAARRPLTGESRSVRFRGAGSRSSDGDRAPRPARARGSSPTARLVVDALVQPRLVELDGLFERHGARLRSRAPLAPAADRRLRSPLGARVRAGRVAASSPLADERARGRLMVKELEDAPRESARGPPGLRPGGRGRRPPDSSFDAAVRAAGSTRPSARRTRPSDGCSRTGTGASGPRALDVGRPRRRARRPLPLPTGRRARLARFLERPPPALRRRASSSS